ncbi:hypothetical protein BSQ35_21600 [Serratia liquefaciens]|uniref:Uncharacterized protein n=1 Tax=Serratia liquefaciens TaxID=614 RepID=A0A515D2S8_SERLI|nr:hypothetical protein EBA31_25180 [Serratia sp. P2ACOL2]OKP16823.1 hypothetical protein BSQ35_21600 [Serratia liquefaciens]QDL34712.1 hypothetical protein EGO53_24355 [Serratia liquefaciens]
MTKWSVDPRYSGLAHRGAIMGHILVSHPTGRLEVVPICSRQMGRRASRYDPIGTLSLITGFVSSLRAPIGALFHYSRNSCSAGSLRSR